MLALEGVQQVRSHALVEVVAAQMVVARRGQHLNDVVADLDGTDTSNVPPPRSYTITFCGVPLSKP